MPSTSAIYAYIHAAAGDTPAGTLLPDSGCALINLTSSSRCRSELFVTADAEGIGYLKALAATAAELAALLDAALAAEDTREMPGVSV